MSIGDTVIFHPRGPDQVARMQLPKVRAECIDKGRVDCGDTNGTLKLWPGERLTVRCVLGAEALIAEFMRQPLLVLTEDTKTEN